MTVKESKLEHVNIIADGQEFSLYVDVNERKIFDVQYPKRYSMTASQRQIVNDAVERFCDCRATNVADKKSSIRYSF